MALPSTTAAGPASPEAVIIQVRRQLDHELELSAVEQRQDVERVVETAVRELWPGRVKTFVPVLALREARTFLRDQASEETAHSRQPEHIARQPSTRTSSPDAINLDNDVMALGSEDSIRL